MTRFEHLRLKKPHLLLTNQFTFMLGFYMVVPFLAPFMREDLRMESAAIGLVLGLRTFSQQGLFIIGGAFADGLGARRLILLGCATRIAGFVVLAFSFDFVTVLLGACLTGFAGALFSPAISSLAAQLGTSGNKETRAQFFAKLAVWGELGAVAGPLLGALLLGIGFKAMALGGAAVFAIAYIILHLRLPRLDVPVAVGTRTRWWHVFGNKLFVAFTLAHSGFLFSYNQLYFALPVEIARSGGTDADLAPLFMIASIMIVGLQLPVTRAVQRLPWALSLFAGFGLMSLAFSVVALFAAQPATGLLPATAMVILLILGQMIVKPIAMDIVPRLAAGQPTGVYYGALASAGGLVVLIGNVALGPLLDRGLAAGPEAPMAWIAMAAVPAVCAVAIVPIARAIHRLSAA